MSAYLMTYRAQGQRRQQVLIAANSVAAWNQGFDIAARMGLVRGFGIAPAPVKQGAGR